MLVAPIRNLSDLVAQLKQKSRQEFQKQLAGMSLKFAYLSHFVLVANTAAPQDGYRWHPGYVFCTGFRATLIKTL